MSRIVKNLIDKEVIITKQCSQKSGRKATIKDSDGSGIYVKYNDGEKETAYIPFSSLGEIID